MKRLSKFEITAGVLGPILLLPLVCLYTFVLAIFGPSKAINIEIEKELSTIRGKGEPVTFKELAPAMVPESENGAFAYEKVFEKVGEIPKEVEALLSKKPSELTSEERSSIRRFLDDNEEGFPLLEEAIRYKRCRFPIDYEQGALAELPHLKNLRKCARLLALKSLWELDEGNAEGAVSTSLKMMRLTEALSTEPFLISQLVSVAIGSTMMGSLQRVLLEGDVSRETLMSLIDVLDVFEKEMRGRLKIAFLGERCSFLDMLRNPFKSLTGDVYARISQRKGLECFTGSRFMQSDKLYGLKAYSRLIDVTELPLDDAIRRGKELQAEVDKDSEQFWDIRLSREWKGPHIFTAMLLPALGRTFECWASYEAEVEETRIAAALQLHKMQRRVYPEHLDELPYDILSPLPKDPFTGEGFIYRKEDDGFILYSVGKNLKDDGGTPKAKKQSEEAYTHYDIVWGHW